MKNDKMTLQSIQLNKTADSSTNITSQIVSDLMQIAPIEDIEAGIVKYFLYENNIKEVKNMVIKKLESKEAGMQVFQYFKNKSINLDILGIEKLFELLIPNQDIQLNGAVYTPPYIADYIIETTINKSGNVCDPACGSGAFLLRVLQKLQKFDHSTFISLIENRIYGVDILDYAIRRTKIILSLFLLLNNEDKTDIKFNLVTANSLKINWGELFPEVFASGGFDFVVSNPPYVRIQDLASDYKITLPARWQAVGRGNFNLYFAFFELGLKILKSGGKLGYITPNNYFTSLAGINLRSYLAGTKTINKILNFNHLKIFENAQTYTAITFLEKSYNKDYFEHYYVEDRNELSDLQNIKFSKYYFSWLDNKKWRLMSENDFLNIKRIESIGIPLGKFCNIKAGIATLKDNIFFVEDFDNDFCKANFNGKQYLIEKSITRKVIKISSINNENDIIKDKRRIIFPYIRNNGKYKLINEMQLKSNFPNTYKYLLIVKPDLETRDKGKKSYPEWYAWGRTQGMDFHGPRLYTKTFSRKPEFLLDTSDDNLFCNGYAVFADKHIKALQKILNSKIMWYYVKKTSVEIEGNYQCYQKNFIEKFGIPKFSTNEWKYLENEDNKEKIDSWLIKKYKLNIHFNG